MTVEAESERFEDAVLPALKMVDGTMSQQTWAASSSWKSKETDFSLGLPERNVALMTA